MLNLLVAASKLHNISGHVERLSCPTVYSLYGGEGKELKIRKVGTWAEKYFAKRITLLLQGVCYGILRVIVFKLTFKINSSTKSSN